MYIFLFAVLIQSPEIKKDPMDEFWSWFVANEAYVFHNIENEKTQGEIFDNISMRLSNIDENLSFEFSPIHPDGTRELMISAEGITESFPAVIELIKRSPKINNWKFLAFRKRVEGDNFSIQYGEYDISYNDIFFRYSTANDQLGIELNIRNFDESGEMKNAIYILLDGLLGEYDVAMKIDWIEWIKLDVANEDNLIKLIDLQDIVDNRKTPNGNKP